MITEDAEDLGERLCAARILEYASAYEERPLATCGGGRYISGGDGHSHVTRVAHNFLYSDQLIGWNMFLTSWSVR